jgi:hypothetical protein
MAITAAYMIGNVCVASVVNRSLALFGEAERLGQAAAKGRRRNGYCVLVVERFSHKVTRRIRPAVVGLTKVANWAASIGKPCHSLGTFFGVRLTVPASVNVYSHDV